MNINCPWIKFNGRSTSENFRKSDLKIQKGLKDIVEMSRSQCTSKMEIFKIITNLKETKRKLYRRKLQ